MALIGERRPQPQGLPLGLMLVSECVRILIVNTYEPWRPDNLTHAE